MAADGSVVILIEGDDSDLKSKLNNIGDMASGAAKAAAAAITAATAAIGAFAKASIDTGMQFDSSMSQVAATMGTTVDQIQELRDFAMEMGASTAFSANEAAQALNYMALAGYDAETAMSMLPTVLDLAAAGGVDLASASDMVTDAQSALGLSIEETAELVDKMAMASSKSNTSVAQLGEAILTIGGTAKNMAGGTTELATALGILADNGIKGAEGGTALRNIILSLSAPTDTAAAALKELGVSVFDAEGNMRPLNETFSDLNTALSSMTQGEQTQVLNKIFNKVDLKSVNALLANTGERFDELSGYIENAAGAAEQMANTQLDNLAGDVTLFQSALEGAQIVLADQLTPSLREFVQFGSEAVSTLSEAFQEGGLSGAMDALGTILSDGLNMVIEQLPQMVDAGMQLLGALGQGLIENTPTITSAALEIVGSLASGIVEALPELLSSGIEVVSGFCAGLLSAENISNIISAAADLISSLADGFSEALPELLDVAVEIAGNLVEAILETDWLDLGAQVLEAIVEGILSVIGSLAEAAGKLVATIWDKITNTKWFQKGAEILKKIIDGIKSIFTNLGNTAAQLVSKITDKITNTQWFQKGAEILSKIIDGIKSIFTNLGATARDLVDTVWDAITNTDWLNVGSNIVDGIANGIKNAASTAINAVKDLAGNLVDSAKDFLGIKSPSRVMAKEVGLYIPQGIAAGVEKEIPRTERIVAEQMAGLTDRVLAAVEAETANISIGLTDGNGGDGEPTPAPVGGTVVNVYVDSSAAESTEKARNMGRELGIETAREMRRRGALPA